MAKQKWEIVELWSLEIRKPVAALSITSYQLHLREASLTPDNHLAKSNPAAANVNLSKIEACKKSTYFDSKARWSQKQIVSTANTRSRARAAAPNNSGAHMSKHFGRTCACFASAPPPRHQLATFKPENIFT